MKKILVAMLTLICVICGAVALLTVYGCNVAGAENGTYYAYDNGEYDRQAWIKLEGKTWTTSTGDTGTVKVEGDNIVIYVDILGSKEIFSYGTIEDGVLTLNTNGIIKYFCKDGKKPSESSSSSNQTKNQVVVTYNANGGKFADSGELFIQNVDENTLLTAPASPTRTGYTFSGWAKNKSGSDMWKFDEDKPTENITLYAKWTEKSAVLFSVDGASIEDNGVFMLVDNDTDYVSLANKVVCSSDSVWRLYYDKLGQTEIPTKIAAQMSGTLYNGNNLFYIVVTSKDSTQTSLYELTIHRSYEVSVGYYDENTLIKNETVYTGSTFSADYKPDISGYTFNYWADEDGKKVTSFTVWVATHINANKTANDYTATLNVNGGDELSETDYTVTYDKGYSFPVPTLTGHSFLGWYYADTQLTDSKGSNISVWNYPQNKTLTAKWQANTYTLTANSNDTNAGTVSGGGDYTYGSNVTLTAIPLPGYVLNGWYDKNNIKVSSSVTLIIEMRLSTTYTAIYEVDSAMENFNFTSTETSCIIEGLKNESVTAILIPGYVTEIGNSVFYGCSGLTSITIPDSVTRIGSYAFSGCSSLTTITIPDSVTSIGIQAFRDCSSLTSITISKNITIIDDSTFMDCSSLTSITIPSSVTTIESSAFWGCSSLTGITIPRSVTIIRVYAFRGCSSLTKAIFEYTNGWWRYDSYGGNEGSEQIASGDLKNPQVAADMLTSAPSGHFYSYRRQ